MSSGCGTPSIQTMSAPWTTEAVDELDRALRSHHAPTAAHSRRLSRLAGRIAGHLCLDESAAAETELVAVLHDIGKLSIERELLDWPGRLSDEQLARMRRHTIEGEELLARRAGLAHLAWAVRCTHEAWDGSGYPDGLRGEEIPLTARIVAVADAFDAMVSARAYRKPLPRREALRRLRAAADIQFDPGVVQAALAVVSRRAGRSRSTRFAAS
jgi:HD-GYP domain-containing protein (c-di-GMP phosphodiesterase class II)